MERTYLFKQEGPTCVWLTDDPSRIEMLTKDLPDWKVCHTVTLKGHQYLLMISAMNVEHLKDDPDGAIEFARKFMTDNSDPIMDWARVLLC